MIRQYFAVYSKLQKDPQAIFSVLSWANRFVREQQKIWVNAQFRVEQVSKPMARILK